MTSRQLREVRDLVAQGMSLDQAALSVGVPPATMRSHLHRERHRLRWLELQRMDAPKCAPLTLEEARRAEELYAAGAYVAQVARALGRHAWVVRRWREAWRKERKA